MGGMTGSPSIEGGTGQRVTAVHEMGAAINDLYRLVNRVHDLADRLVGPALKDSAGPNAEPPSPDNLFGAMRASARDIAGRIGSAMEALDRIEEEMP